MASAYVTSRSLRDTFISLLEKSLKNRGVSSAEFYQHLDNLTAYPRAKINDYLYLRAVQLWLYGAKDDLLLQHPIPPVGKVRKEDSLEFIEETNGVVEVY